MGLDSSGRIGRIVIDPNNPDIVFVAAQGFSYGPQEDRGVYRTTDGGAHWQRVLFVDRNTGAIDVVMHPTNPQILFAATWQLEIHTYGRESGGPGSAIYQSTDGGTTWTRLTGHGLPSHEIGKIGLAIARSNPNRVYALIARIKTIDLDQHRGEHPRIGASDVVPFVPIRDVSIDDCVNIARRLGKRVGEELNIPVYLYEAAATRPDRENLENIRRGQYEGLKDAIHSDPARMPDFGPAALGKAGATVIHPPSTNSRFLRECAGGGNRTRTRGLPSQDFRSLVRRSYEN